MKKINLSIDGMTCSACSNGLEKYLNKQKGVNSASVNLVMANASIEYDEKMLSIDDLNEDMIYHYMFQDLPPMDFMIRTSGELRLSNFMLYQLSYAELYFPKTYFPDFNNDEFDKALVEYTSRDRRFGGIDYSK